MTRCLTPGCKVPHDAFRYGPHEWSEPIRRDPGYDAPRPLSRGDLRELVRMIPAAVVVVAGLWMFLALLIALVPS